MFAVVFGDGGQECHAGFIVQDVDVRSCMLRRKTVVEIVVCGDAVTVVFGFESLDEDGVGFTMPGHHDVLVAAACPGREVPRVVREDVVDGDGVNIEGWSGCGCAGEGGGGCDCRSCGADVLPRLCHMSL